MSKMKLVFTGYREDWDQDKVTIAISAELNGTRFVTSSLPLAHKRATSETIRKHALICIQDVVEEGIFRKGMRASDYDRDLDAMLKEFDVFLHIEFRKQCIENEIPFANLLNK